MNELRNLNDNCLYCNRQAGDECRKDCFTEVFKQTLLKAPNFKPSQKLIDDISTLIAEELYNYMNLVNRALTDLGNIGRQNVLAKDFEELHSFAEALEKAGHFEDKEQVFDFYKNPYRYKRISLLWRELGKPKEIQDETWKIFSSAVESYQHKEENG